MKSRSNDHISNLNKSKSINNQKSIEVREAALQDLLQIKMLLNQMYMVDNMKGLRDVLAFGRNPYSIVTAGTLLGSFLGSVAYYTANKLLLVTSRAASSPSSATTSLLPNHTASNSILGRTMSSGPATTTISWLPLLVAGVTGLSTLTWILKHCYVSLPLQAMKDYRDKVFENELQDFDSFFLNNPKRKFFVATVNGEVAGCAGVREAYTPLHSPNTYDSEEYAMLTRMMVAPEHRGLGLSRMIFEKLRETASKPNGLSGAGEDANGVRCYKKMMLYTSSAQLHAVKKVYPRFNFKEVARFTPPEVPPFIFHMYIYEMVVDLHTDAVALSD